MSIDSMSEFGNISFGMADGVMTMSIDSMSDLIGAMTMSIDSMSELMES